MKTLKRILSSSLALLMLVSVLPLQALASVPAADSESIAVPVTVSPVQETKIAGTFDLDFVEENLAESETVEQICYAPCAAGNEIEVREVAADDGETEGEKPVVTDPADFSYTVKDSGEVTLTKYNGSDTVIVVPSTIQVSEEEEYPVTALFETFKNNRNITSVTIPEGVTVIGRDTFYECTALKKIILPDSLTDIGKTAFRNCSSLETINYPMNLTKVGGNTSEIFTGCTSLKSIVIPEGVTKIPGFTFRNATALEDITFPSTLVEIGECAFGNTGIKSLTLPENVKTLGEYAFAYCEQLEELTYPVHVTSFGYYGAFGWTPKLAHIDVPEGVTEIPRGMFYQTTGLRTISFPSTLTSIGEGAFEGSGLVELTIDPAQDCDFGSQAFKDCDNLQTVTLGEHITKVGRGMFYGCENLREVTLPDGLTEIGIIAFAYCSSLGLTKIPVSVKTIYLSNGGTVSYGSYTANPASFYKCDNLSFYCNAKSYARAYAELHFIPCEVYYDDSELPDPFDDEKTYYMLGFSGVTKTGYLTLFASYSFTGDGDVRYITINLPQIVDIESVTMNGETIAFTTQSEGNRRNLNVNTHEKDGCIRVNLKMNAYGDFTSYATVTYTSYDYVEHYLIGTVRQDLPMITIETLAETSQNFVDVSGVTLPNRYVTVSVNGEEAGRFYANKAGHYAGSVPIDTGENGKLFTIRAEAEDGIGGIVSEETVVKYDEDAIVLTRFDMQYLGVIYDLINQKHFDTKRIEGQILTGTGFGGGGYEVYTPLLNWELMMEENQAERYRQEYEAILSTSYPFRSITYRPGNEFAFAMKISGNPDKIDRVYVNCSCGSNTFVYELKWNAKSKCFYRECEFSSGFYPRKIQIEYVLKEEPFSFFDMEMPDPVQDYAELPDVLKDAQIEIGESGREMTIYNEEYDMRISYRYEDLVFRDVGDALNYIAQDESEDSFTLIDSYGNKAYCAIEDYEGGCRLTYIVYKGDAGEAQETDGLSLRALWTGKDTAGLVVDITTGVGQWSKFLTQHPELAKYLTVSESMGKTVSGISLAMALGGALGDTWKYQQELTALLNTPEGAEYAGEIKKRMWWNAAMGLQREFIAMGNFALGMLVEPVCPVVGPALVTIEGQIFDNYLNDKQQEKLDNIKDLIRPIVIIPTGNWFVDPSGYIYDLDTEERIADATVTLYWIPTGEEGADDAYWENKPADDVYGEVWNAEEWSDINPIITMSDGEYAWDVPEGWWRVKAEAEDYETAWSEWLPVPPPQTEVNIGLKSTKTFKIGDVNQDGEVNATDRMILSRYLAGWEGYGTKIKSMDAADIDRNGLVEAKDRMILARYLAGWTGYDTYFK